MVLREKKNDIQAVVTQEGDWFVAQCLDMDVASQGRSAEEAIENLHDALELHFTEPIATYVCA